MFVFSFEDSYECARILRDRPWLILGFLLIVQERLPFVPMCDFQWKRCLYWIEIHGIPVEGFTDDNILKIGAKIGEVIEYDQSIVNGVVVKCFMRIKVWIELDEMLTDGFWISRLGLGKCWIAVRYEKLQMFYHKCGVISHDSRDCGKDRVMSVVNPTESGFGGWIGAISCRNGVDVVQCSNMEGVEVEEVVEEKSNIGDNEVCINKFECSSYAMNCDMICKNKRLFDSITHVMHAGSMLNVDSCGKNDNVVSSVLNNVFVEDSDKENLNINLRSVRRRNCVRVG